MSRVRSGHVGTYIFNFQTIKQAYYLHQFESQYSNDSNVKGRKIPMNGDVLWQRSELPTSTRVKGEGKERKGEGKGVLCLLCCEAVVPFQKLKS